jgi:5-methylcytosine-specific restriction endonuclease McrA
MESLVKKGLALSSKKGDPRNTKAYRRARVKVLNRDGHVCMYCGTSEDLTIDHVLSIKNHPELAMDMDNMVIACKPCNSRKGSRSQGVFLAQKDTPPVFMSFLSPTRSNIAEDSPFKSRPVQD